MMFLKRNTLKKDNSGQGNLKNETRTNLKKDNSGKNKSEQGKFYTGKSEKEQVWTGQSKK